MQKIPLYERDLITGKRERVGDTSEHIMIVDEVRYDGVDRLQLRALGNDGEWKILYETLLEDLDYDTMRFPLILKVSLWGQTFLESADSSRKPQSGEPEQKLTAVL